MTIKSDNAQIGLDTGSPATNNFTLRAPADGKLHISVGNAGTTTDVLTINSLGITLGANTIGVYFGSGAPAISAAQGSLYLRTDGSSSSTRLYVNTNGSTTWTNVTTAA